MIFGLLFRVLLVGLAVLVERVGAWVRANQLLARLLRRGGQAGGRARAAGGRLGS